jgi:hypothetical protein
VTDWQRQAVYCVVVLGVFVLGVLIVLAVAIAP